jgi:hypothetical protein
VKVLYILGSSRCGSTLVGNILGEFDGFFNTGELRFLWDRIVQGRRCGCGAPINVCPIWQRVLHETLNGRDSSSAAREMIEFQRFSTRLHKTWSLVRQPTPVEGARSAPSLTLLERLYISIKEVTGARVIVDTSKRPSNGSLLRLLPAIDEYYLMLVRDSRAVAFSRASHKVNPDGKVMAEMPRSGILNSVAHWSATNLAGHAVTKRSRRSLFMRYEDFVDYPERCITTTMEWLSESPSATPFERGDTVSLGTNHTVSGNPDRFVSGAVPIKPDDRWVRYMTPRDSFIVTALTMPLLIRYGFSMRRPSMRAAAPG